MVSNNIRVYQSKDIFYEINRKKMQCQDVKTIVKCCLFFFFIWKKKTKNPCHSASELSFASMLLSGVGNIFIFLSGGSL